MTRAARAHNIGYVPAPMRSRNWAACPQIALTKRRAVDFCRVTTALCPVTLLPQAR